jgi:hypothetical protein
VPSGVLQQVPAVAAPDELLVSATRKAQRLTYSGALKNDADRERNRVRSRQGAEQGE